MITPIKSPQVTVRQLCLVEKTYGESWFTKSFILPLPWETVSQFVIPAKFAHGGREPGSRENIIALNLRWIPDLAPRSGTRPE